MASDGPVEIELKVLLPDGARPAVEEYLARRAPDAAPEVREERTAYFDSPRLGLAQNGISLRVRHSGGRRVQTLKTARRAGGAASVRGEWEWPVEGDMPDLSLVAGTGAEDAVAAEAGAGLEPVFETRIQRTVRTVELAGGGRAEAAIDEGTVVAGGASEAVSELELELKEGAPGPLLRLALDLHGAVPFLIGAESKAERGYRLRTGQAPRAMETKPPALDGDAPAAEAIRRIVAAELGHLLSNLPAAAAGGVEGVHQVRIGIRRLRTLFALFGRHLEPHAVTRFEAELKRLGRVFGGARDWDVFCTELLPVAEKDDDARGWAELLRTPAEEARRAAHQAVEEELRRPELTGLVLGLAAWVEPDGTGTAALGSAAGGKLERKLGKLVPSLMDGMARRAEKRGGHLRRGKPEKLHDFRKSLKKLRYAAEYVGGLYPAKAVKRHAKRTKRVLKLLGAGNDAAVAVALAERLADGDAGGGLAPAVAGLVRWSGRRRAKALRKLPKAWDAVVAEGRFWR